MGHWWFPARRRQPTRSNPQEKIARNLAAAVETHITVFVPRRRWARLLYAQWWTPPGRWPLVRDRPPGALRKVVGGLTARPLSRRSSSPRARTPAPCQAAPQRGRSERARVRAGSRRVASVTVRPGTLCTRSGSSRRDEGIGHGAHLGLRQWSSVSSTSAAFALRKRNTMRRLVLTRMLHSPARSPRSGTSSRAAKAHGAREPAAEWLRGAGGLGAQTDSGGRRPSRRPDYLQLFEKAMISFDCKPG